MRLVAIGLIVWGVSRWLWRRHKRERFVRWVVANYPLGTRARAISHWNAIMAGKTVMAPEYVMKHGKYPPEAKGDHAN